jgi:hypothetical protein
MPDFADNLVQICTHSEHTEEVPSSSTAEVYDVYVSRDGTERCTCPGFTYRGRCKHVTAAREKICEWREDIGPEKQTPQQEMEAECPRCGSSTDLVSPT